jgi:hypothetical protein
MFQRNTNKGALGREMASFVEKKWSEAWSVRDPQPASILTHFRTTSTILF